MSFLSRIFGSAADEKLKEYRTFTTGISFVVSATAFECHNCGAQFVLYDHQGGEKWQNGTRENGGDPKFCPYCGK